MPWDPLRGLRSAGRSSKAEWSSLAPATSSRDFLCQQMVLMVGNVAYYSCGRFLKQ